MGQDNQTFDDGAVAAAWDRQAEQWSDAVQAGLDVYREFYTLPAFLDFMPEISGLQVLDLGCGEGSNTRRFAQLGGRMTGIDLSARMIERARRSEQEEPLGIRYDTGSFSNLAIYPPESFDAALSTMALMDGPNFEAAMREAHRVLVPGGWMAFSILHPCFITRAAGWLRTEDGEFEGLRVGGYFDKAQYAESWRFKKHPDAAGLPPFEVPRFPRTLSDYVNAVCAAGFRITRIEEPRPDEARCKGLAWLKRWYDHAPLVLLVAAMKER